MEAIVAVYSDWGIGSGGTQPVVLKADRAHFRQVTEGAAVIVGRRTLEDFPGGRPLKGRHNIVVTGRILKSRAHRSSTAPGRPWPPAAVHPRCLVIGGASVYKQFFPHLDCIYATKIDFAPHSDSFFPNLDRAPDWRCEEQGPWQEENGLRYCFCTYRRVS